MTRARTLADMISDGVIGTTELADDAITPVKLDETGNYTIAQLDVNGTLTADGLTVDGLAEISASNTRLNLYETDTTDENTQLQSSNSRLMIKTLSDDGSATTERLRVDHTTGDISFYDTSGNQKFYWDASASSLGLGTSSPSGNLHVYENSTAGSYIFLENTDGSTRFQANNDSIFIDAETHIFRDSVAGGSGEYMRIDSSGNLLVGTTDTTLYNNSDGSEGVRIAEDHVSIASDARTVFYVNRQTSDGEIINIRKDGTTVGSIGNSTTNLLINSTSGSGLFFGSGTIAPMASGSLTGNTIDIGTSSYSFKDGYFGGTVNSGGLTVDGGTAYHKLISTFPSTYKTNLQVGQQGQISNDAITDTLSIENTGTAGATNIQFSTAGSERMRIDSSGRVGISYSNPSAANNYGNGLVVGNSSISGSAGLSVIADTDIGYSSIYFGDTSDNFAGGFEYNHNTDVLAIFSANAGQVRVGNNELTPTGSGKDLGSPTYQWRDLYLSGGIQFDSRSNKLDDYEEGTWAPRIEGYSGSDIGTTQTYSTQDGYYTKIGNMVYATFMVRLSSKGNIGGNYAVIRGLPFNHSGSRAGSFIINFFWSLSSSVSFVGAELGGGASNTCWLTKVTGTAATSSSYMDTNVLTDYTGFQGTLVYRVS